MWCCLSQRCHGCVVEYPCASRGQVKACSRKWDQMILAKSEIPSQPISIAIPWLRWSHHRGGIR